MFYVVGLGNPGVKYAKTRHNAGWWVLDVLITTWELPRVVLRERLHGRVTEGSVCGQEVTVLYPETFMNNAGLAVAKLVPTADAKQLIVVYDDVDLPVGTFKMSFGNGAVGHNGVASIIERLGTKDFIRVRLGIAAHNEAGAALRPTGEDLATYVLSTVTPEERQCYEDMLPSVTAAVETIITDGYVRAMNTYN